MDKKISNLEDGLSIRTQHQRMIVDQAIRLAVARAESYKIALDRLQHLGLIHPSTHIGATTSIIQTLTVADGGATLLAGVSEQRSQDIADVCARIAS